MTVLQAMLLVALYQIPKGVVHEMRTGWDTCQPLLVTSVRQSLSEPLSSRSCYESHWQGIRGRLDLNFPCAEDRALSNTWDAHTGSQSNMFWRLLRHSILTFSADVSLPLALRFMVGAVSPASISADETISTLRPPTQTIEYL